MFVGVGFEILRQGQERKIIKKKNECETCQVRTVYHMFFLCLFYSYKKF